jgi:hypothetical protein
MLVDSIKIINLALNNMKLDELIQSDISKGSNDPEVLRDMGAGRDKSTGMNSPYMTINGYSVSKYLDSFSLDLSGFLPVIRFSFAPYETVFMSVNYPKDGDIVSVYMRSPGDFYNPFRMDFKILSVSGDVSSKYSPTGSDSNGTRFRFYIVAECYVPGLYSPKIKSFRQMNSADVLLEVSQDLNLGFATNEKTTNDTMTWMCPNYSYYDFIQEVCLRSYKDDEQSFFDCWIDSYYNLNFVNMGSQFAFDGDPKQEVLIIPGYVNSGVKVDAAIPGTPTPTPATVPLVLTNAIGAGVTPFFINGYTLTSRAGNVSNEFGYITEIGFYDEEAEEQSLDGKYVRYDIETQTTDNVKPGTMLQKGRVRDNEYKNETRREWFGVLNYFPDLNDGVHQNYYHATIQNMINIREVSKMTLEVEIGSYFPGIIRGMVIPVSIYVFEGGFRQQNSGNLSNKDKNTGLNPTMDNFLSGNYVVTGIEVYWSTFSGGMKQKLILSKRTWTANSSGTVPKAFPISIQTGQF